MMNVILLGIVFGLVILFAVIAALIVVGLAIYRSRAKANRPGPTKEVDPEQAAEITSTWNLLNH